MTIVLGAVAGVAFVALLASLIAWRSASKRLAEWGVRAQEAEQSLRRAVDSAEKLSNDLADERRRAGEADRRVEEAAQRTTAAEARAGEAESELAVFRSAGSPLVLAEVERVRLEREWNEVAGPGAALPVAWDGSVAAALMIELEIIREVTGTPSRFESDGGEGGRSEISGTQSPIDAGPSWVLAGIGCELMRVVARYADELLVSLEGTARGAPRLRAEALRAPAVGDLSSMEEAAKAVGMNLSAGPTADGFVVWLTWEGSSQEEGARAH